MRKKWQVSILLLLVLAVVSGCKAIPKTHSGNVVSLALNTRQTVQDVAEITLYKVSNTTIVQPALSYDGYAATSGQYIDLVLDVKNLKPEDVSCSNLITATATDQDNNEYKDTLYALETDGGMGIDASKSIAGQGTARLHCAIAVPMGEGTYELTLLVDETEYNFTYTIGETWINRIPIGKNQMLEESGFASLIIEDIEITEDLLPPDASGSYNHYRPDSSDNVYIAVRIPLQNQMSISYPANGFVAVHAAINETDYNGFLIVLDQDEQGFLCNVDLAPNTHCIAYALIEIPKSLQNQTMQIILIFGDKEYTYSLSDTE